ncbi:MAG: hypothetical protein LBF37_02005 [Rickettsiales bacterium]|nr:hypothetical protein [Rickettsiales bacterium]
MTRPCAAADLHPGVTVGHVRDVFALHGCNLTNSSPENYAANMEYLLKIVDICNRGATGYGATEYATLQGANTYAVDWCADNLLKDLYVSQDSVSLVGWQYIDTGIILDSLGGFIIEADIQLMGRRAIYGSSATYADNVEGIELTSNNGIYYYLSKDPWVIIMADFSDTQRRHTYRQENKIYKIDGGVVSVADRTIQPQTVNLVIGALNQGGTIRFDVPAGGVPSTLVIYAFKVWNAGALARDFVPVKSAETGEYGLWDNVSRTFFPIIRTDA